VTEAEVSEYLSEMAQQLGVAPEALRARLTREGQLDNVRISLRNRKALAIVRSAARVETQTALPTDASAPEETVLFQSENR